MPPSPVLSFGYNSSSPLVHYIHDWLREHDELHLLEAFPRRLEWRGRISLGNKISTRRSILIGRTSSEEILACLVRKSDKAQWEMRLFRHTRGQGSPVTLPLIELSEFEEYLVRPFKRLPGQNSRGKIHNFGYLLKYIFLAEEVVEDGVGGDFTDFTKRLLPSLRVVYEVEQQGLPNHQDQGSNGTEDSIVVVRSEEPSSAIRDKSPERSAANTEVSESELAELMQSFQENRSNKPQAQPASIQGSSPARASNFSNRNQASNPHQQKPISTSASNGIQVSTENQQTPPPVDASSGIQTSDPHQQQPTPRSSAPPNSRKRKAEESLKEGLQRLLREKLMDEEEAVTKEINDLDEASSALEQNAEAVEFQKQKNLIGFGAKAEAFAVMKDWEAQKAKREELRKTLNLDEDMATQLSNLEEERKNMEALRGPMIKQRRSMRAIYRMRFEELTSPNSDAMRNETS